MMRGNRAESWQETGKWVIMFHVKPQGHTDDLGALSAAAVAEALGDVGVTVSGEQAEALGLHARMVVEANTHFNLTRISQPSDVLIFHIVDSALALHALQGSPVGAFADLGSGPGYPGVVLAVLSGRPAVLVESVKKKAGFLTEVALRLDSDIEVVAERAEQLAVARPSGFVAVVARAVSSLPALVELAAPLLALNGRLVAMKGRPETSELVAGRRASELCGMTEVAVVSLALGPLHARTLVVYEKRSQPKILLPRHVGLAQRSPLA
jgi:16S rRNA (guanine527-N7)-methyltransferase